MGVGADIRTRPQQSLPKIVLLPGMDGSGTLFAHFVAALGATVDCIVVRYPTDRFLDYAALADGVLPQLPVNAPYVLLGESFSGPIAIALAARHPPGLTGLILCATFARNPRPQLAFLRPVLGLATMSPSMMARAAPLLLGPGLNAAHMDGLRAALLALAPSLLRDRLRAVIGVDVRAQWRALVCPTLYLQARHDRLVPAASARELQRSRPDLRIERFDAPHLLLQTQPRACAESVLRFVREQALL